MKGILKMKTRTLLTVMALAIAVAFTPGVGTLDASAATKTPSKPSITSTSVELANITIKWDKASRAKTYQVARRTSYKKWCYVKRVRGTKANRNKYTQPGKYKVVRINKGRHKGKLKVYKYKTLYSYKVLKSNLKTRSYTYKAPERGTTYTLTVRAVNGKKKGKWVAKSATTWNKDTVLVDGVKHTHKWDKQYKDETRTTTKKVLVDTIEHTTKIGTNTVCITCNEPILFTEGETEPSNQEIYNALQEHNISTGCNSEGTKFEDKSETTYENIYEDREVEETVQVLSSYKCSCGATKTLGGKVTEHVHSWDTRTNYKTAYKTVTYGRTIIVCKDCWKRLPVKYRDAEGVWHDYVEKYNPDNWYSACPEATEHLFWEAEENNGTGSSYSETEDYKTEKVAYKVPYTETYCTTCGKIK